MRSSISSMVFYGFWVPNGVCEQITKDRPAYKFFRDDNGCMIMGVSTCCTFPSSESVLEDKEISANEVKMSDVQTVLKGCLSRGLRIDDAIRNELLETMRKHNVDENELGYWFVEYTQKEVEGRTSKVINHKIPVSGEYVVA